MKNHLIFVVCLALGWVGAWVLVVLVLGTAVVYDMFKKEG